MPTFSRAMTLPVQNSASYSIRPKTSSRNFIQRSSRGVILPCLADSWRASKLVALSATGSGDQASEDDELQRLLQENLRLRKIMAQAAPKMEPQQRQKFAEQYQEIAQTEAKLGIEVDESLFQNSNQKLVESAPGRPAGANFNFSGSQMSRAGAGGPPPAPSAAVRVSAPASGAGFGVTAGPDGFGPSSGFDSSGEAMSKSPLSEDIDSRAYLEDIVNLSVDLDPFDDSDDENAPPPFRFAPDMMEPDVFMERPTAPVPVQGFSGRDAGQMKPERVAARKLVNSHIPSEVVTDKHHWMVVTVPELPVAGEEFVIYFNRNSSDSLRHRPRIQVQYGFNNWELKPEDDIDKVELMPSGITRDFGADFWSCRIKVPMETYELNFVLNDGAGMFENNYGKDFKYAVQAGISWDEWVDSAAERAAKAAADKLVAEQAAAEEAEKQRKAMALEQDKEKGRKKAEDLKNGYENIRANGATMKNVGDDPAKPLWKTVPAKPCAGSKVTLMYNRMASPLAGLQVAADQSLTLRYGFNGWQTPGLVSMTRDASKSAGGQEWWVADVEVPKEAAAVNFVVNYFDHYDNNGRQDYKLNVGLPAGQGFDAWINALAETFFQQLYEVRIAAEEAERKREEVRIAKRREAQAIVKAVERRKVRHVMYTEPEVVSAGKEITLFYNPSDTVLNGRERIFIRGGWNRWNHARTFGPIEMTPPTTGFHHQATVKVPADAFKMDYVFSDVESGDGTYDTRGGLDYHLPVEGSAVREPQLYVAHISVEMAPIAKVGGLGDVVTALGRAVKDQGHQVEIILPKYQFFNSSPVLAGQMKYETEFDWGGTRVFVTTGEVEGLRCFFIEPRNGFFDTQSVYGRYDDEVRFDFFCKAALEFLLRTNRQPDILHCHDWSTAYVAKSYWDDYHPYGLWKPKVIFTIHNLNYGKAKISQAAYYCQKFTTVSPTYAAETGGNPVIASQTHKFMGIRNGIDLDLWDPENNQFLPVPFNANNVVDGKKAARKALRERVGLGQWGDKFIVGVVSRLTGQKGVPLIKHAAYRAVERGGQFVLLGSAPDPKVQAEFNELANSFNGDVARFCFKYDEPLSHLIYAACDMIVVPSMFEPCGLTQMIAMRYGSVPIVRHTGGLKDTVFDVDFDKARAAWEVYGSSDYQRDGLDGTNGFAFTGTDPGALDYAMNRAIDAWYNDRTWFHGLQKRVMEQDWSWNRPALDYIELYHGAKKA